MNNEQTKTMTDADFEAFCRSMSKNPSPGFRSLGDELGGHENAVVTFGLRAAGSPLTGDPREPATLEPGEPGDKD